MTMKPPDTQTDLQAEGTPLLEINVNAAQSTRSELSVCSIGSAALVPDSSSSRSISDILMQKVSSSERVHALQNLGIGPASRLIRDAVLGQESQAESWYDPYSNDHQPINNFISILCGRLLTYKWMVRLLTTATWTLVLLTFFEPPYWCRDSDLDIVIGSEENKFGTCGVVMNARGSSSGGEENVELYPNSSSMWLTVNESRVVEWVCLSIITAFMLLYFGRGAFDLHRFFYKGHRRVLHTTRCLMLALSFCALLTQNTMYNPFFRVLLLATYQKSFLKEFKTLVNMVSRLSQKHQA